MNLKSIDLIWISVSDLKQAIKFYTETVGLKLMEHHEEFGWAELEGPKGGARLGIAQMQTEKDDVLPGQNAVLTFSVESLEKANEGMVKNGVKLIGDVQVIPGHVKMQMAADKDGNHFQIVQVLSHSCAHC